MVVWNISYVPLLPVGSGMLSLKLSSQLPHNSVSKGAICSAPCALADTQPNILHKYILGFYTNYILYKCLLLYKYICYVIQNIFVNRLQVSLYITLYFCLYPDVIHCLRLFSGGTVISSFLVEAHLGLRCPVTPWITVAVI